MRGLDQTSVELVRGKPEDWVLAHLSFDVCGRPRLPGVQLEDPWLGLQGWGEKIIFFSMSLKPDKSHWLQNPLRPVNTQRPLFCGRRWSFVTWSKHYNRTLHPLLLEP